VYPNNGQSVAEPAEIATDVVAAVLVEAVEADPPPPQAVAASPAQLISAMRMARLSALRDGIGAQATSASGCQRSPPSSIERLSLRARSQLACSTRSGAFSSLQSWQRSDATRRRGSANSPPQARQMNPL
jgi:hypothetical protein